MGWVLKDNWTEYFNISPDIEDANSFAAAIKEWQHNPEFNLPTCIKNFLTHPHIEKLINEDKWEEVFNCWGKDWRNKNLKEGNFYGNSAGWSQVQLAVWLVLAGVEFIEYLDYSRIESFENDCFEWRED